VRQLARELDGSFVGRDALPRRPVHVPRVRDKLACLDVRRLPRAARARHARRLARPAAEARPIRGALFNEGFGLMLLVSDSQRLSDHGAGLLALRDLLPATPRRRRWTTGTTPRLKNSASRSTSLRRTRACAPS